MKKLSVYIHIPFCVKKCHYCDFLSGAASEEKKRQYVDRLVAEIEKEAEHYREYSVVSVFFGGGTPSVLQTEDTGRIMDTLKKCFVIDKEAEITSEVNPGTADYEKLKAYRKMGFNRLSIGLQSADDKELKLLGRIHDYQDFLWVYQGARKAGFDNVNVDIMSALPGQTVESYRRTVEKVLELEPEHISAYSLMIEEGTPFFTWYGEEKRENRPSCGGDVAPYEKMWLPSEEEERRMYDLTEQLLQERGYHRYEISNYARAGRECRHNTAYWVRQNYVGFGIGAASLVENVRFKNVDALDTYLAEKMEKEEREELSVQACMEEFMFLGLRLTKGVGKEEFLQTFGVTMEDVYGAVLDCMEKKGLLINTKERVCLTKRGGDVSNYVMAEFLLS